MARALKPRIATGNALLEGDVVYFTAEGGWSRDIGEAAVAADPETAAALLERAREFPNEVVGVYLAEVRISESGRPAPDHFREMFRTLGPSNYPWLGKQAEKARV